MTWLRVRTTSSAHTDLAGAACWGAQRELYSASDDGSVIQWSAKGERVHEIAYTAGAYVRLEPVEGGARAQRFLALDAAAARSGAVVLSLDWSRVHGTLVTAGEDCRYCVWDDGGRAVFRSDAFPAPLTAIAWRPAGDAFAVGAHGQLLLCDRAGWVASAHAHSGGGAHALAWAADGMCVAMACGRGDVLVGTLLGLARDSSNLQVSLKEAKCVAVADVATGATDDLDFADPVVTFLAAHGKLLVVTTTQWKVFQLAQGYSAACASAAMDTNDTLLATYLAPRCFCLLLAAAGAQVFDYHGKHLCAPRAAGIRADALSAPLLALSDDTLAIVEPTKRTSVHFFSAATGAPAGEPLRVRKDDDSRRLVGDGNVAVMEIASVALSQFGEQADRLLVFLDRNSDLHLCSIAQPHPVKLAASVHSYAWHDSADILAAVCDNQVVIWYYPAACLGNKDLVDLTRERKHVAVGDSAAIEAFSGQLVAVRCSDGARITAAISPYMLKVYALAKQARWDSVLQLCRFAKERVAWAACAALALKAQQLTTAEAAFAAIEQVDKVAYLRELQALPSAAARRAQLLLMQGRPALAEEALLSAHHVWGAVELSVRQFAWPRALALAQQAGDARMLEAVLWFRAEHLHAMRQDPMVGGKEGEPLEAFARLFQERGVPAEAAVLDSVHAMRVEEGLVPSED